jgi:PIN domain nuclease of toxin-antitoxin system
VISIWEIALKAAAGKLPEQLEPDGIRKILVLAGWTELPFTGEHAVATRSLPMIHSDPFDRALVAQAQCERTTLLTADKLLGGYGTAVSVIKPRKGD